MILQKAVINIKKALLQKYSTNEIKVLTNIIFQKLINFSKTEILTKSDYEINKETYYRIESIVERLLKYEPIEYIFNEAEFYNLKFYVSPDVLIPRPETEELIEVIKSDFNNADKLNIIDIGTGSGCIAIALAKIFKKSEVNALDISKAAIEITEKNAKANKIHLNIINHDILNYKSIKFNYKFDIIVSNPPYVLESEKEQMQANVLNYEPELALFVNDSESVIYYKAITDFALKNLKNKGTLYFEINENKASEVSYILKQKGFLHLKVIKDINKKNRFIKANF